MGLCTIVRFREISSNMFNTVHNKVKFSFKSIDLNSRTRSVEVLKFLSQAKIKLPFLNDFNFPKIRTI